MIVKIYQYIQEHIHTQTFIDYMALLLLVPFVFAIVEYVYIKKARKKSADKNESIVFTMHSNIVLLVYVGVQFFMISPEKLPIVFALASVAKLCYICVMLLLQRAKSKKMKKESLSSNNPQNLLQIIEDDVLSMQIPSQQQEEAEVSIGGEKDVHIDHIYKTLENLRRQKLTTGDRLECKKIEEILRLYCMKEEFTKSEVALLNDILASLLKMMAKYTI